MTPTEDDSSHNTDHQVAEVQGKELPQRKKSQRLGLKIGLATLGFALVAAVSGAVLAQQVSSVRNELEHAMELVPQLRSELEDGNHNAAQSTLEKMQQQTSSARSTTTGPLWQSATVIPVIGTNFSAVREVAASADDITTRAAMPLMDRYDSLNWQAVTPADGRIDVTQLEDAAPDISAAAKTVRLSYERMASIDLSRLIPELGEPVESATEQLRSVADVLDTAASAAQLLPVMLGADGPRDYLVLVQNSAEARATGGIPGALAILHTDDGRITLGEQTSAVALGAFRPMVEVDPEQVALYTGRLGTQMQNVNLTPNFPTAAETAKEMWEKSHPDQTIDGVVALDPVVLSRLLGATGRLDLADAQVLSRIQSTDLPSYLTKENVVPTLLSDVYREIDDPEAQDAYFAAVAGRVFSAFTDGQGDGTQLVKALGASTKEGRLYLWSSHNEEQKIITSTPLHGSVTGPDSGGATFGVYFNDGTGAKMDYYATRSVELLGICQSDDYEDYVVRVTVTNEAPEDAATALPAYVTGNGSFGVLPGRIRTNYVIYGPAQAFVGTATVDGNPVAVGSGKHGQRPVGSVQMELGPGETKVMELSFSGVIQKTEPRLHVTPSIRPIKTEVEPAHTADC